MNYDNLDRLIAEIPPQGVVTYTYDNIREKRVKSIDGGTERQTVTHTYDVQDRLATRTDPLGITEIYEYDLNGSLVKLTDRKGQISQFVYDENNRRVQASYADGTVTIFTYDAVERLLESIDSALGRIEMSYDNLDRLIQEITPQGLVNYAYDVIGRRTSMSASGLPAVTYSYDAASRVIQVAQETNVVDLGYDVAGRRTSLTYPNGTSTDYFYDDASRVTEILHNGPSGVIEDVLYTYDAAGNRQSINRTGPDAALPSPVQAAHNTANQLVQLNTDTLTYDENGNMTFDGTTTYTWDARNRLVALSGPGVSGSFVYDALGRRMSKTANGVTNEFLYDGNDIVAEIQGGAVTATYLRSLNIDEPFIRSSGVQEYYHTDALGSSMALTDENGVSQATYSYEPFGNTTQAGTSVNPFQYTGRENDGAGLYYLRARYYSPMLERFIGPDPLLCGSTNAFPLRSVMSNAQSLNSFAYVSNSPLNLRDPLGLSAECQYYDQRCSEVVSDFAKNYYCSLAKGICEESPGVTYFNCVRQCLQDFDQNICVKTWGRKDPTGRVSKYCSGIAGHAVCFTTCVGAVPGLGKGN